MSRIEPTYVCPKGHPLVWRCVAWKQCSACRVEAALEDAVGLGALPGRPRALIKLANPFRYHTPRHLERIAPTIYGGGIEGHPELLERFAETLRQRPPSTRGFLWQLVAAAGWTSLPWLRSIPHPTLVVAGDRDPIVPLVNARLMTRLIPNARLHVVRGGGHLFLLTHAGEVASVIGDFLRASGPASGEAPGA